MISAVFFGFNYEEGPAEDLAVTILMTINSLIAVDIKGETLGFISMIIFPFFTCT
jgi:hypothetical protein